MNVKVSNVKALNAHLHIYVAEGDVNVAMKSKFQKDIYKMPSLIYWSLTVAWKGLRQTETTSFPKCHVLKHSVSSHAKPQNNPSWRSSASFSELQTGTNLSLACLQHFWLVYFAKEGDTIISYSRHSIVWLNSFSWRTTRGPRAWFCRMSAWHKYNPTNKPMICKGASADTTAYTCGQIPFLSSDLK